MNYWLLRSDGSSVFQQAYDRDFLLQCLVLLLDAEEPEYYYLCSELAQTYFPFPICLSLSQILD